MCETHDCLPCPSSPIPDGAAMQHCRAHPCPAQAHAHAITHTHTSLHTLFKIRFLLLQNRQGKTRLSKWYVPPPTESEKFRLEADVHKLIVSRDRKYTNFVEYQSYKLVYRRYAGLYFSLGVDVTDNELAYLESIHLFVELLDEFFRNVCELDIVFNFNKVRKRKGKRMHKAAWLGVY